MAEATTPVRRRRQRAESNKDVAKPQQEVEETTQQEPPREEGEDGSNGAAEQGQSADAQGGDTTLVSELRAAVRGAAIEVLKPVAREATSSAAKFAVKKGPELVKNTVGPKVAEAGGAGELAKGALGKGGGAVAGVGQVAGGIAEKVTGKGKGGKKPTGHGRGRRLPVQEHVDVAVDVETAYDQF